MAKKAEATLLVKIKEQGRKSLDAIREGFAKIKTGVVVAGAAIAATLTASLVKYRAQEKAVNTLNAAIKAQGLNVKKLSKDYQDWASAIQKKTIFGDEEIIQATALAQSMVGQLELTEDLIKATVDFAAAQDIDLKSAFNLVGKSIGSNLNALSRYGIEIDASASKQEKLAQITEKLKGQFDGVSDAQAKGLGRVTQLTNSFGDFLEKIGEEVAPAVEDLAKQLRDFFDDIQADVGRFGIKEFAQDIADFASNSARNFIAFGRIANDVLDSITENLSNVSKAQEKAWEPSLSHNFFRNLSILLVKARLQIDTFIVGFKQLGNSLAGTIKAGMAAVQLDFAAAKRALVEADQENTRIARDNAEKNRRVLLEVDNRFLKERARERRKFLKREEEDRRASVVKQEKDREQINKKTNEKIVDDAKVTNEKIVDNVKKTNDEIKIIVEKPYEEAGKKAEVFLSQGIEGGVRKGVEVAADSLFLGLGEAAGQLFDLLAKDTEEFAATLDQLLSVAFVENLAKNLPTLIEEIVSADFILGLADALVTAAGQIVARAIPAVLEAVVTLIPDLIGGLIDRLNPFSLTNIASSRDVVPTGKVTTIEGLPGVGRLPEEYFDVRDEVLARGGSGSFQSVMDFIREMQGSPLRNDLLDLFGLEPKSLAEINPERYAAPRALGPLGRIAEQNRFAKTFEGQLEGIRARAHERAQIIINANGGLLGNEDEARKFAKTIDSELYKLREDNESRVFADRIDCFN